MYRELEIPGVGVLWRSSASASAAEPTVIPADGSADLILRDDELLVAGPSTRWLIGQGSAHGATVGLRFAPGHASAALGVDAAELRDRLVLGADALAPATRRRGERLLRTLGHALGEGNGDSGAERDPSGVELRSALSVADINELGLGASAWTAEALRIARGGAGAAEAAAHLGYSERQLQRRMQQHFGYGYTALRRVLRAEQARALLRGGLQIEAAASRAGYSDQAHLTREFGRFVGTTPGRFVTAGAASEAAEDPRAAASVRSQPADPAPSGA